VFCIEQYHLKDEMSVCFLSNWLLTNLPRLMIQLHKYVLHQLTTGYTQLSSGNKTVNVCPVYFKNVICLMVLIFGEVENLLVVYYQEIICYILYICHTCGITEFVFIADIIVRHKCSAGWEP